MLYLPPPEKSQEALTILGVQLRPDQKKPKTWEKYENLLASRLVLLCQDQQAKSGLVNYLLNEGLLESKPENDLELVNWLLESDQFHQNQQVSNAHLYLAAKKAGQRASLSRKAPKDPAFRKQSESRKLLYLKNLNLWEWWDSL